MFVLCKTHSWSTFIHPCLQLCHCPEITEYPWQKPPWKAWTEGDEFRKREIEKSDFNNILPSGKLLHNYGKSSLLMGKSTISMAMFNSYAKLEAGTYMLFYINSMDHLVNYNISVPEIMHNAILGLVTPTPENPIIWRRDVRIYPNGSLSSLTVASESQRPKLKTDFSGL